MGRLLASGLVAALVAVGCTSAPAATPAASPPTSPPSSAVSPPTSPSPSPTPGLSSVKVGLRKVATLDQPLAMAVRTGDPSLYVAEKTGRVMAIRDGRVLATPILDLAGEVSTGGEQGLLGLAFSPDGAFLYVNYTDRSGDTNVDEYAFSGGTANPASRRRVLFVHQPFANHNGGDVVFGPDGYLYIGLGDGGSGGDPFGNGQSLSTLLGKMLRIDPRPHGSAGYGIPPGNPFAGMAGARAEIWAYGLRNPWRYSFDRQTGDLWIGDVGQNAWEEVDAQAAGSGGQNYGWNRMEGNHPYEGSRPTGAVGPVYEYPHEIGGCAITGGYVYRGTAVPGLQGAYVLADFCLGQITALGLRGRRVVKVRVLGPTVPQLASFGEDAAGELYALSLAGGVYQIVAK